MVYSSLKPLVSLLSLFSLSFASPLADSFPSLWARDSVTPISPAQVSLFHPYSFYASTAYCDASVVASWSCGLDCTSNSNFMLTANGGDGALVQYWFVGYDPKLQTVVVAHQGTHPQNIISLLTSLDVMMDTLDPALFPGIDDDIQVHHGFAKEHAKTAKDVLKAVSTTLSRRQTKSVTVVGHSLGAAVALLDTLYLSLHLPKDISISTIGYASPMVGNQAFANFIDSKFPGKVARINNKEDLVPILPGTLLGYHHVSGEIHIADDGSWNLCSGQGNKDKRCAMGAVPNIFSGNVADHKGPYDGVKVSTGSCSL